MNDDDLTGIFDDLTPDDFFFADRSASTIGLPDGCSFEQFITIQHDLLKYAFAAADGKINPLTILATDTQAIAYQADDDEKLGDYIARMAEEAKRINARWSFFYKKTLVAASIDGRANVDNPGLLDELQKQGEAWECVYWYASRNDGEPTMRHGYVKINKQRLGPVAEAPEQPNEILDKILER
jgi:hypothetical protein